MDFTDRYGLLKKNRENPRNPRPNKKSCYKLVDFLIGLITTHFTNSIFQNSILLEEMIDRNFVFSIIMHRTLQEETQETLDTKTSCTCSQVTQQYKVQAQRSSKNRITAKEINLNLHWIPHPSEDINIIPTFFIIITRRIVIDTYFMIVVCIQVR